MNNILKQARLRRQKIGRKLQIALRRFDLFSRRAFAEFFDVHFLISGVEH
jgi:hypothetical protein